MNPHVHDFGGNCIVCALCGVPRAVADRMGAYYNPADPYDENGEASEDFDDEC